MYTIASVLATLHLPYPGHGSILARESGLGDISVPVRVSVRDTTSEISPADA